MELSELKIDRESGARRARSKRIPAWAKWAIIVVILALLGVVFRPQLTNALEQFTLPSVVTERVVERTPAAVAAATGTSSNGYIVAKTRAALSADTAGRIVEMNVEEGSVVKRGDVVARLYSDEYAAALRQAEADLSAARAAKLRAEAESVSAQRDLETLRTNVAPVEAELGRDEAALRFGKIALQRATELVEKGADTQDRLDQAQRDLDDATARVKAATARIESTRSAIAQGEAALTVARARVSEAEAQIQVAQAARDLAQATLDKTAVRAPFDGIVVLKDAEVGEVVSPNSQGGSNARGSVVTMVDFASLEVQAEVPETAIANAKVGGAARIYLDAYPEKPYVGRVDRIWPTANRTKATIEVRVAFVDRDDRLRPEMGVRVVFIDAAKPAGDDPKMLVSASAVVRLDGQAKVFVVEADQVRLRNVDVGSERAGKIAVLAGLSNGELVVTKPDPMLKDGDRVRQEKEPGS
jgi:HlyD family secretion protein